MTICQKAIAHWFLPYSTFPYFMKKSQSNYLTGSRFQRAYCNQPTMQNEQVMEAQTFFKKYIYTDLL